MIIDNEDENEQKLYSSKPEYNINQSNNTNNSTTSIQDKNLKK
jgi:hypothetical protein